MVIRRNPPGSFAADATFREEVDPLTAQEWAEARGYDGATRAYAAEPKPVEPPRPVIKRPEMLDFINPPCQGKHDVFFPDNGVYTEAKAICAKCPIRYFIQCRQWGVAHEAFGCWGGTTPKEREQIRAMQGIALSTPQFHLSTQDGERVIESDMVPKTECVVCHDQIPTPKATGRCRPCRKYLARTGVDRPAHLIARQRANRERDAAAPPAGDGQ